MAKGKQQYQSLSDRSSSREDKSKIVLPRMAVRWVMITCIVTPTLFLPYIWGWIDFKKDDYDTILNTVLVFNGYFSAIILVMLGAGEES